MIYTDSDPSVNWLNDWLVNYGIYIALGLAGVVFIVVLVLFLISLKKRKESPLGAPVINAVDDEFATKLFEAIGGKENLESSSLNGSRISVVLKDYDLINEKLLTECGVDSFIKMSNKITLVSKSNSEKIYKGLNH